MRIALSRAVRLLPSTPVVAVAVLLTACGREPFDPDPVPEPTAATTQTATEKEFGGQRVSRVEELFVGRFPGVEVLSVPGGMQVRVRGQTTLLGTSEPLFVVDGTPLGSTTDGLIALNPKDVARIEVLKDAASTSMYGLRGSNGVIRIITKR